VSDEWDRQRGDGKPAEYKAPEAGDPAQRPGTPEFYMRVHARFVEGKGSKTPSRRAERLVNGLLEVMVNWLEEGRTSNPSHWQTQTDERAGALMRYLGQLEHPGPEDGSEANAAHAEIERLTGELEECHRALSAAGVAKPGLAEGAGGKPARRGEDWGDWGTVPGTEPEGWT
jgi:hypothetical protein